jgi:hypothetical protein
MMISLEKANNRLQQITFRSVPKTSVSLPALFQIIFCKAKPYVGLMNSYLQKFLNPDT